MRKALKWIGIVLGVLVLAIAAAMIVIYITTDSRMNQLYAVTPAPVAIPTDSGSIAEGKRLYTVKGCTDCHGPDLSGDTVIDVGFPVGRLFGPNLTPGGAVKSFSDVDWVRAIRHGVRPDSLPLIFMPSHEFWSMSDQDLGMIIAYCKSVPPVNRTMPEPSAGPLSRALFAFDQMVLVPAEKIDHKAARPAAPVAGVTVEYGKYLAETCVGCHGTHFSGGPIPGAPPDWPPPANLTPSGELAKWSDEQIATVLRTGRRPDGRVIDSQYMPWKGFALYKEDEVKALILYIRSLPSHPAGQR